MDATEIRPLTEACVAKLLEDRCHEVRGDDPACRRKTQRWPFPGTVELWVPDETGEPQLMLATCINLGRQGIGIKSDEELGVGVELAMSVHQPEATLHGRGCVRHCTELEEGYFIGIQFVFGSSTD